MAGCQNPCRAQCSQRTSSRRTNQTQGIWSKKWLQPASTGEGHDTGSRGAVWPNCPRGIGHVQQDYQPQTSTPCPIRNAFFARKKGRQLRAVGPAPCFELHGRPTQSVLEESARPTLETLPQACRTPPRSLSEKHERMSR